MTKINACLKTAFLACLFSVGASDSWAGYPPPYGTTPNAPSYNAVPGGELIAPGPPPPPQREVIIAAPSPAYVWVPGYWNWQNRWIWMPGQWVMPPKPGFRWIGHQWLPHESGNGYRMQHGGWR